MRIFDASLIVILTIVGVCAVVGIVSQFFMGDDNAIEECMEEVIEVETGLEVDLSP